MRCEQLCWLVQMFESLFGPASNPARFLALFQIVEILADTFNSGVLLLWTKWIENPTQPHCHAGFPQGKKCLFLRHSVDFLPICSVLLYFVSILLSSEVIMFMGRTCNGEKNFYLYPWRCSYQLSRSTFYALFFFPKEQHLMCNIYISILW